MINFYGTLPSWHQGRPAIENFFPQSNKHLLAFQLPMYISGRLRLSESYLLRIHCMIFFFLLVFMFNARHCTVVTIGFQSQSGFQTGYPYLSHLYFSHQDTSQNIMIY